MLIALAFEWLFLLLRNMEKDFPEWGVPKWLRRRERAIINIREEKPEQGKRPCHLCYDIWVEDGNKWNRERRRWACGCVYWKEFRNEEEKARQIRYLESFRLPSLKDEAEAEAFHPDPFLM